jgi:hypothetical protein
MLQNSGKVVLASLLQVEKGAEFKNIILIWLVSDKNYFLATFSTLACNDNICMT